MLFAFTWNPSLVFPQSISRLSVALMAIEGKVSLTTELTKKRMLQRLPHVAFTCLAWDSWWSGWVITQQRTRTCFSYNYIVMNVWLIIAILVIQTLLRSWKSQPWWFNMVIINYTVIFKVYLLQKSIRPKIPIFFVYCNQEFGYNNYSYCEFLKLWNY